MANLNHETETKKKSFAESWLSPHPAIQDTKKRGEARLAAEMSLIALSWTLLGVVAMSVIRGFDTIVLSSVVPLAIAYAIAYLLCRTPYYMQGITFLVIAGSIDTIITLASKGGNVASTLFGSMSLIFIIGTALLSKKSSIILVLTDIFLLALLPIFSETITPKDLFRDLTTLLFFGLVLIAIVTSRKKSEEERLLKVEEINKELKKTGDSLEEHIEKLNKRTLELELQSSYLRGAAEISRITATLTDTEKLSQQAVKLIREHFSFYYVGLFLIDESKDWTILKAGAGKSDEIELPQNYRLMMGTGIVGWVIQHGEPRLTSEADDTAIHFEHHNLPNTRSEAVLPLRSRGRILGALSVQSDQPAEFTPQIVSILQAMADQIAVAFDNAELLAKSETALKSERRAYGEFSRRSWQSLIRSKDISAYAINAGGTLETLSQTENPEEIKAIHEGRIIQEDGKTILLPIKNRGQILGGIRITRDANSEKWTKEEIQLAETLAEQLSVALESARLFEETQYKARREAIISDISTKIGSSMNLDAILQTTVKELGKTLGSPEVTFEIVDPEKENSAE